MSILSIGQSLDRPVGSDRQVDEPTCEPEYLVHDPGEILRGAMLEHVGANNTVEGPARQTAERFVAGVVHGEFPHTPISAEALDPGAIREFDVPPSVLVTLAGTIIEQGLRSGVVDQLLDFLHMSQNAAAREGPLGRHAYGFVPFHVHPPIKLDQFTVARTGFFTTIHVLCYSVWPASSLAVEGHTRLWSGSQVPLEQQGASDLQR